LGCCFSHKYVKQCGVSSLTFQFHFFYSSFPDSRYFYYNVLRIHYKQPAQFFSWKTERVNFVRTMLTVCVKKLSNLLVSSLHTVFYSFFRTYLTVVTKTSSIYVSDVNASRWLWVSQRQLNLLRFSINWTSAKNSYLWDKQWVINSLPFAKVLGFQKKKKASKFGFLRWARNESERKIGTSEASGNARIYLFFWQLHLCCVNMMFSKILKIQKRWKSKLAIQ